MCFVLILQVLTQVSVIEAILYVTCFCVSIYPITKYLSLNLISKTIRSKKILSFIVQFITCSVAVAIIAYMYRFAFYYLEQSGSFPISAFFNVEENAFEDFIRTILSTGVFINICFCGLGFYLAYSNLEKEHLEAQLQMLQAQITPHFMFNILHHVNVLMQKDVDTASELLVKYSNVLRYQLYSGKEELVSIGKEVQFLKEFIYIEETRWKNLLDVKCQWDIENENCKIYPLLLVVPVENAFKHVSRTTTERGYINIQFEQKGHNICLVVENSKSLIHLKSKKNTDSGIGLENIKRRLNILYPAKHNLIINETDSMYFSKLQISL